MDAPHLSTSDYATAPKRVRLSVLKKEISMSEILDKKIPLEYLRRQAGELEKYVAAKTKERDDYQMAAATKSGELAAYLSRLESVKTAIEVIEKNYPKQEEVT